MKAKTIVTKSWNGNREMVCFEVIGVRKLKLLLGVYEGISDFAIVRPGFIYTFITLETWMHDMVKGD
jgi:hypothetical protein